MNRFTTVLLTLALALGGLAVGVVASPASATETTTVPEGCQFEVKSWQSNEAGDKLGTPIVRTSDWVSCPTDEPSALSADTQSEFPTPLGGGGGCAFNQASVRAGTPLGATAYRWNVSVHHCYYLGAIISKNVSKWVSNCSSPCTWALINAYGNNFWTRKPQYWSGQRTGVLQQCLWFWCDTEYPTIAWTIWGGGSGWYAQGWFA